MKKISLFCWVMINAITCSAQGTVTLTSLLNELADRTSVAKLPDPSFELKQVSSYDRHSVSPGTPGWFANDDHTHFIRTETRDGHKEYVMMDETGPGAIVRFWETTFKRQGTLRIYFDNEQQARIVIPAYDLMKFPFPPGKALLIPHSSYEPVQKGGSTLYLPLPYNKHCKVTWEDAEDPVKEPRYYQISFRKYKAGTRAETFSAKVFEDNRGLINKINEQLTAPDAMSGGKRIMVNHTVPGGSEYRINLPAGAAAVNFLQIKLDNPDFYTDTLLRSLFIKAEFDGSRTVYCPVSDFFGSGAGNNTVRSWYRNVVPGDKMNCRWIMPYRSGAAISLVNKSGISIGITVELTTEKWKWNSNSLYFHANWRQEKNVEIKKTEADGPIEWDLNTIKGQGIFAGETLSVNNHMHKWYGEGDQKLWVDNENFPSEYGTGLEDYYNTSWAPVVLYQTPFANATRADNPDSYGENTFTRTRNLDIVPFNTNFRFSVEMLGWENGSGDVAATTYWYGKKSSHTTLNLKNKQ